MAVCAGIDNILAKWRKMKMGREGKMEHREDGKREDILWEFKFGRIREVNNIQGKTRLWENKGK